MKAKFIGQTGYGYVNGQIYHILIFDRKNYFWVISKNHMDIPYQSSQSLFKNWELID